ncbi:Rac-like GTP-binding protein [Acrasis kona]|uniref:Rac-like GTP-binding protein n=1 Tax=Acrasis kona TaxID=1008807 RepID=A0AAW2ZAE4_9EUKA
MSDIDLKSGKDVSIKVVVIGDAAVGKSCLLLSYANNSFPEDYIPTVFDNYSANMIYKDTNVTLGLWDSAGTSEYDSQRILSYPDTNVFLIVYDISNASSLNKVDKWVKEIKPFSNDGQIPFMLVGNKLDLRSDPAVKDKCTSKTEAEKIAKKIGAKRWIETSAKTQENLSLVFQNCVDVVAEANEGKEKKNRCKQQ